MKQLSIFLFLLFSGSVQAQTKISVVVPTDSSFTLKQCIDYALQNNPLIKNTELDEKIAKAKVGEIRSVGLPQISGAAAVVDNPELRRLFLEKMEPSFFPLPGNPGDVVPLKNFFQLRSSGDASVTVSQLIFNGSYIVGLQAARGYKELTEKSSQQTKIQSIESVTKAYYLVLINQERVNLFQVNLERLDSVLRDTKILYRNGFVEKIDVSRIEVQYNNLLTERQNFDNSLDVTKMLLKFQMGMPLENNITLKDKISDIKLDTMPLNEKVAVANRIEYKILKNQEALQRLDLKNIKAGYFPSLAAFGTGGLTRQDKDVGSLFSKGNLWYRYSMLGLNLSVPISQGGSRSYKAQQSKLTLKKLDNAITLTENTISLEVQSSQANLKNSLKKLEFQKQNLNLAAEVSRVAKIKYKEGVGSNLEVINAEAEHRIALTNYFNNLYEVIVAKVDYQKALGTLTNE